MGGSASLNVLYPVHLNNMLSSWIVAFLEAAHYEKWLSRSPSDMRKEMGLKSGSTMCFALTQLYPDRSWIRFKDVQTHRSVNCWTWIETLCFHSTKCLKSSCNRWLHFMWQGTLVLEFMFRLSLQCWIDFLCLNYHSPFYFLASLRTFLMILNHTARKEHS